MQPAPIYDIWRLLSQPREAVEAEIRATCRTVYIGENEALTRILGRYKMYVDTRDIGIASHLMMEGFWEMWVTEAMMRLLRRGAVVADVGANLGYFTLLMADLTGAEGRVLAFEPNPELARRLEKSIAINGFGGFTDFYPCGLGGAEGLARMDVRSEQPGGGRTIPLDDASNADEAPALPERSPSSGFVGAMKSFFLGEAPGDAPAPAPAAPAPAPAAPAPIQVPEAPAPAPAAPPPPPPVAPVPVPIPLPLPGMGPPGGGWGPGGGDRGDHGDHGGGGFPGFGGGHGHGGFGGGGPHFGIPGIPGL